MSTPAKVRSASGVTRVSAGLRPAVGVITRAPLPTIGAPGSGGLANSQCVCKLALEIESAHKRKHLAERDPIIASQSLGQIEGGPLGKDHLRAAAAAVGGRQQEHASVGRTLCPPPWRRGTMPPRGSSFPSLARGLRHVFGSARLGSVLLAGAHDLLLGAGGQPRARSRLHARRSPRHVHGTALPRVPGGPQARDER